LGLKLGAARAVVGYEIGILRLERLEVDPFA
jgi:hypothetical protein